MKAVIRTTILFDTDCVDPTFFGNATLPDIEDAMNDDCIGRLCIESIHELPKDTLNDELIAIGNDGAFFDNP